MSRRRIDPRVVREKVPFSGVVLAVQPRIRLTRSFDQRSHTYQGYTLRVLGAIGTEAREALVGIGVAAQQKHALRAGDHVRGEAVPVADPRAETVELYKVSKLVVTDRAPADRASDGPPWTGAPPTLDVYRARGHRRLAATKYEKSCTTCMWGCVMAVEMIVDQWRPERRKYRNETACYGPLSCRLYAAGPTRKVAGRKGMSWEEEDWVDADAVSHRGPDE